jgi:hypothetical protein
MQRRRVARKFIELEKSDPIDPGAKVHILTLLTKKERNFKLSETPPHSKFPKTTPNPPQKKKQEKNTKSQSADHKPSSIRMRSTLVLAEVSTISRSTLKANRFLCV